MFQVCARSRQASQTSSLTLRKAVALVSTLFFNHSERQTCGYHHITYIYMYCEDHYYHYNYDDDTGVL